MPVAYLALGHIAKDLTPTGPRLGGTAAFAALTARALGYTPALVTAHANDFDLTPLMEVTLAGPVSTVSTTFENRYGPEGRSQFLRARATPLVLADIPSDWRNPLIAHVAPLAGELTTEFITAFPQSFVGLTPQGWLRTWDNEGRVSPRDWPEALSALLHASAVVLSLEDVRGDWGLIERWAAAARVLVVTLGAEGCKAFSGGRATRHFPAPPETVVDPTGAGDIFAAAFFINLYETGDPWASARFANQVAALSVTRPGLEGVPTVEEMALCRIRVA